MSSSFPHVLRACALLALPALAAAQSPRAYWTFDSDFRATVGGASFDGVPQNGVAIDAANARIGGGALRVDPGLGDVTYGSMAIASAQSNFSFSGTSTLGPIVGNPASFQLAGSISLQVDRARGPIATAAFNGGDIVTSPATINALVRNPIVWLPPLATVQIAGARFSIQSAPFAVAPGGGFAAQAVLVPIAGTVTVTPLVGTPTTSNLSSAGPSTPTAVNGTLAINGGALQLTAPLNVTFTVDDGQGNSATINLAGSATAAQTLLNAPPSFLSVAGSAVTSGQPQLSVTAWARYTDHDGQGSPTSNTICAGTSSMRFFFDNARAQSRVNTQDTGATSRSAADGTAVDTQWHHLAFVYDAASSRLRFYRDGVLRADQATGGLGLQGSSSLRIGQDAGSLTTGFDGWIDDLAVFASALSAEQIAALAARRSSPVALPYGRACGGIAVSSSGLPQIGANFQLEVQGGLPNAPAILLLGTSRVLWQSLPLPFDLGALGAVGCDVNVAIDASLTTATNGAGDAAQGFAIPLDPMLVGGGLFAQWALIAPGQNPLGLLWSSGIEVRIVG
ncbi:MAG: hypothetical protein IPN34_02765 [Planctomycetes bacterium]|nr:hypothetical protein [Planctomycetota bacterium]